MDTHRTWIDEDPYPGPDYHSAADAFAAKAGAFRQFYVYLPRIWGKHPLVLSRISAERIAVGFDFDPALGDFVEGIPDPPSGPRGYNPLAGIFDEINEYLIDYTERAARKPASGLNLTDDQFTHHGRGFRNQKGPRIATSPTLHRAWKHSRR